MKFLKSRGVLFFFGFSSSSLLFLFCLLLFLSLPIYFYSTLSFPFLSYASDAALPTKLNSFATSFCSQLILHAPLNVFLSLLAHLSLPQPCLRPTGKLTRCNLRFLLLFLHHFCDMGFVLHAQFFDFGLWVFFFFL